MKTSSVLIAAAIGVAGMAANAMAVSGALGLNYVGSTTQTTATGLTIESLNDPTRQTTAWHHYFEVTLTFTQDVSSNQAFRFLGWGATLSGSGSGQFAPCTPAGVTGGAAQKYVANNPVIPDPADPINSQTTVFQVNSDGGISGDDLGMFVDQTRNDVAFSSNVGEAGSLLTPNNRLGRLIYEFTGPSSGAVTITVLETPGNNFSYFNAPDGNDLNFTTLLGGVSSASLTIVPEPGSLGLLALGGMGLLVRRRRAMK